MNKRQWMKKIMETSNFERMKRRYIERLQDRHVKSPKDLSRYIGIEIECYGPYKWVEMHTMLAEHNLEEYIQIGEDGSISGRGRPYELRLLIKQNELGRVLPKIGKYLKKTKLQVNRSCGLHVHIDTRKRNKKLCLKRLVKFQDALFSLVKKDRWTNTYCGYNTNPSGKYNAINPTTHRSTIEVRLHHGSVDMKAVHNWIKLLLNVVDSKTVIPAKLTKESVLKWRSLRRELKPYVAKNFTDGFAEKRERDRLAKEKANREYQERMDLYRQQEEQRILNLLESRRTS